MFTPLLVQPHSALELVALHTAFPHALSQLSTPTEVSSLLSSDAAAPLVSDDEIRGAIRDLLRVGGFKPTGRSKPSSEYLLKAAQQGSLSSINLAVDVCNAVSLHSGLPISVVDAAAVEEPLRVAVADAGSQYVFNASGQTIDVGGLLCLLDRAGPCANAVKDAQRTKTSANTRDTLTLIWGSRVLGARTERTAAWYRELLERSGASVSVVRQQNE